MKINRQLAIQILKYLYKNPNFYFPFIVVCKEYSSEDDDFVELEAEDWRNIEQDEIYQTFELWENLQDLSLGSLELLLKGFIDKMSENKIKNYIFITFEGFTEDSQQKEVENMQVLGFTKGKNPQDAFKNLKKENKWLIETSFNETYCIEILDKNFNHSFSLK